MSPSLDLAALYEAHASALFSFLLNLTRNEADTRDCLQETFCRIAARPALLERMREPRAFLFQMAYRISIDQHRRRAVRDRHAEAEEPLFAPASNPDAANFRRQTEAAMAELPEDQRAVVHLKLWEHLTFEEIARILDLSSNTAASRYRYGLDKLRALLRPLYEEIK